MFFLGQGAKTERSQGTEHAEQMFESGQYNFAVDIVHKHLFDCPEPGLKGGVTTTPPGGWGEGGEGEEGSVPPRVDQSAWI